LLRDGKLVFMLERSNIEGRDPQDITEELREAFDRFCAPASAAAAG
jgi:putative YphP/YqiW family bacilliredoxin